MEMDTCIRFQPLDDNPGSSKCIIHKSSSISILLSLSLGFLFIIILPVLNWSHDLCSLILLSPFKIKYSFFYVCIKYIHVHLLICINIHMRVCNKYFVMIKYSHYFLHLITYS